jgi:hypothetical protein
MKKVLKIAMAVAIVGVSSASAYSLWNLSDGSGSIANLGSGEQGGAIFGYDDKNNSGTSYSDIPEGSTSLDVIGPWLEDTKGTIHFTTTAAYQYSFVGIGFNWLDPEAVLNPTSLAGGGISVCYMSQKEMVVDLKTKPGDKYEYNSFVKKIPPASTATHLTIAWSEFAQGDWGGTGEEPGGISAYLAFSAGVQFKFEGGGAAAENTFRIGGLGWYGDGNTCASELSGSLPVRPVGKLGGFSLTQQGRVLHFNGLDKKAVVEIITMQGSVVKKAVDANSVDLSNLSAGIYMVRVNGSSLKYTQKVLLK